MASTNRTVAFDRAVFRALYGSFGARVVELAEQVEASADRTRAALKRLETKGLAAPQDVNDAAQGDRRSGAFKSLAWVSQPCHDDATAEQADEAFNVAYDAPTLADDETADAPATKQARDRKKTENGEQPATESSKPSGDGLSRSQVRKCECTGCDAILRMSPGAEQKAGGLPTCACGGSFVRSNVAT